MQKGADIYTVLSRLNLLLGLAAVLTGLLAWLLLHPPAPKAPMQAAAPSFWQAPDTATIPGGEAGAMIRYGRDLIVRTAHYLGPQGAVAPLSNGLNCQNCHLEAGAKAWGNNYGAVASTYPLFRARSGSLESVEKRIADCFERSLNGRAPADDSREMQAIKAYILWLGSGIAKGEKPKGSGIYALPYLDRPADPMRGKAIYAAQCQLCHMENGQGLKAEGAAVYTYPPLWGNDSYNSGAGLYRLSRFAGYVKYNMPLGASFDSPVLTDEEAWDVAAYVNSQQRPEMDLSNDWPDITRKPADHPFGPFADGFSEQQHKYGPFKPIQEKLNTLKQTSR